MPESPFQPSESRPPTGGTAFRPDLEKGFQELQVRIPCGTGVISGDLVVPPWAKGLVLFAHGTGSSRQSPRNQFVAAQIQAAGMATLLLDLLTQEEEREDASVGPRQDPLRGASGRALALARCRHVPDPRGLVFGVRILRPH